MARRLAAWVITVVDAKVSWRKATAKALVTEAGLPLSVAGRWAGVRRAMSPKGLKKALKERVN